MSDSEAFSRPGFASVIGDVIKSRSLPSRGRLQHQLEETFEWVNLHVPAAQPLAATLGDEFQALYGDIASALKATLLIRLRLHREVDIRFGVGWGLLVTYASDAAPYAQDGPAWWAARDAIDLIRALSDKRDRPRGVRTAFVSYDADTKRGEKRTLPQLPQLSLPGAIELLPEPGELPTEPDAFVNAFLITRDELVHRMDKRDARILLGSLEGWSQAQVAEKEDVSQSAVSQRLIRNGGHAVMTAHRMLESILQ